MKCFPISSKLIAMSQYGTLDFAYYSMVSLDCSWGQVTMIKGTNNELVLELLCKTEQFWGCHEEIMPFMGVILNSNDTNMNVHESVKMFIGMACSNRYERDGILGDGYIALFKSPPCIGVDGHH
ncbi:hypothetical protein E2C01_052344 [Portunus trituberculatus]|uniref:Uncharacterized protein n=1 Tax=Portunus trituberculatus TaxID=210409 RepID=A0A5B7GLP1_PORTR|nr:hypothetical protein [Portunus trituberculatus]